MGEEKIFLRFTAILRRSGKLEIPRRCLCNSSKEVKGVTASFLVEFWCNILKFVNDTLLFLLQVEMCYSERPWLLCKEIGVILNRLD